MSTRANVVIKYEDRAIGAPSELWLLHHHDGNVQGIGEEVVRTVHDSQVYVDGTAWLNFLLRSFPCEFEDAFDLQPDIEFLYRITYADNRVTVVVRHGGYVGENARLHYSRSNDTPDNSAELYNAAFVGDTVMHVEGSQYDIREPESYIRTLMQQSQPAVRAWRGRLR
jgi:hypothetical protein